MHGLPLLVNIAVALSAALVGGLLARRAGVPPLVGYLLAGVAIGPFTPGFVGDITAISQLAELGVVFLMFGVGLHFSLRDLWRVRAVAVPGALGQMVLATLLAYALARFWGWSAEASLVLGLAISVASTVVLLRGLMDDGLLNTAPGSLAVGWLVLEDLATVLLLLVLPALASGGAGFDARVLGLTLAKAAAFIALMLVLGARVVPFVLLRVARTRSRELFLLVALTVALGSALGSAALFGVSLALGAFLFGKALIAFVLSLLLGQPLRTGLVVAAGLSQIGEFSFILGQAGVKLKMLDGDQYSLILASAVLSITVNPLMFRLVGPLERALGRSSAMRRWGAGPRLDEATSGSPGGEHVVVVGCGRVGGHVVDILGRIGVPRLVVESDSQRAEELQRQGVPVLFGDAANSEILTHAGLDHARALVVTIPDEAAAARLIAPSLPIVARAATPSGVKHLLGLGAQDVIHPELEGGRQIVRHTLLRLGFPLREVQRYGDIVRRESYDVAVNSDEEHRALLGLLEAARSLEISWVRLGEDSPFVGERLSKVGLRAQTGAWAVAIHREGALIPNPGPDQKLEAGDRLGLIGEAEQVDAAEKALRAPREGPREPPVA